MDSDDQGGCVWRITCTFGAPVPGYSVFCSILTRSVILSVDEFVIQSAWTHCPTDC